MLLDQELATLSREPGCVMWAGKQGLGRLWLPAPSVFHSPCLVVAALECRQAAGCSQAERVPASFPFLPLPSALTPFPPFLFQLAPENTLMSLQKAVDCNVQVFETDVMVR